MRTDITQAEVRKYTATAEARGPTLGGPVSGPEHLCLSTGVNPLGPKRDEIPSEITLAPVCSSEGRASRSFLAPDLPIPDDLAPQKLSAQKSAEPSQLATVRPRAASLFLTSNRGVEEGLSLSDGPIPGDMAMERSTNASYQIVIRCAAVEGNNHPIGSRWSVKEET